MKTMHGHSLVELMFCLLIGGILLSLALPSFTSMLNSNTQTQLVNQLLGQLHYARSTAVQGKASVALCSGHMQCSGSPKWERHLLAFIDRNRNGQIDAGEELLRQQDIPPAYSWHWSNFRRRPHLLYQRDGTTRALNGTFTLCREGQPLQQVVISVSGRARTQSPAAGASCG
ncbi:GspH/FimT family pseudopilin [Zestomonas carbonaria]|uniref:Type II secretion system protein H n=1 Tax=Zestomonas carbonaria TaxID=2762745 RepID=A0A7U7IA62_9GAMM|nr:GspH/FimT family pseudopilin [Pseudomonas carbonaria]CAD5109030.1 hypothetical protein PSEWESI4_03326 [Pseudomonas carbonaria]